jgi:hypothetical protein
MKSDKPKPLAAEDTERQRCRRASRKHLEDLRRAHNGPPADVAVRSFGLPKRIEPEAISSYRSSPSQMCSELGE